MDEKTFNTLEEFDQFLKGLTDDQLAMLIDDIADYLNDKGYDWDYKEQN